MPQRIGSPFQFGQAVLEPIVQPVYDRVTITAAAPAGTFRFFVDVAGKTNREIFPGITGGGQLSAPRMMVIYSSRLHMDELQATIDIRENLANLLYRSHYRLRVGIKDYLIGPGFMWPSGFGIAGFAATTVAATTLQTATNGVPAFHSHFSMAKRRIAVPPQQNFSAEIVTVAPIVLTEDIEVWNVLDTEFGFEVQ